MIDYLDLESLLEQGIDLYDIKKPSQALSYIKQARNMATQLEKIYALNLDLKEFKNKCNLYIGRCYEEIEKGE